MVSFLPSTQGESSPARSNLQDPSVLPITRQRPTLSYLKFSGVALLRSSVAELYPPTRDECPFRDAFLLPCAIVEVGMGWGTILATSPPMEEEELLLLLGSLHLLGTRWLVAH